jgi:EAL domain-containing protein (putative c-di-GMP-specific phosphodiesterase class I)
MLRDADIAMYQAKARGKNGYRLFDSTMHTLVSESLQMENELRQAIRRQEMRLHYQPILDLTNDRIAGFEALLRWQHPRQGLLRPEAFLDIAEEADLLVTIGRWTLEQATGQLAIWQQKLPEASDAYVAVNLSNRELTHPGLVENLTSALSTSGIAPQHLRLEITENMLIDHSDQFAHILDQLRALGISLAIDDFGTGYSSFGYLERLTFDVLKIDRAFVQAIDHNARRREIVRAIIMMTDNLGLTVIAEGGETTAEINCLREIGCRYHQGMGYCAAVPPEEIETLLSASGKPRLSVVATRQAD